VEVLEAQSVLMDPDHWWAVAMAPGKASWAPAWGSEAFEVHAEAGDDRHRADHTG
jgi:hypothetical protein